MRAAVRQRVRLRQDKQGRGALIGGGIGAAIGFIVAKQTFNGLDEPNGRYIALTTVVGGVLGMVLGASVSYDSPKGAQTTLTAP